MRHITPSRLCHNRLPNKRNGGAENLRTKSTIIVAAAVRRASYIVSRRFYCMDISDSIVDSEKPGLAHEIVYR